MRLTIILASAILILSGCANNQNKINQVCFADNCFQVELATTSEQKTRGLMYRESMPTNQGMFFIFDKLNKHSFWMKNTLIPLDIIWLDENPNKKDGASYKVVFIKHNAQPCEIETCPSIIPAKPARYVLELNAGVAENIDLNIGDKLTLK